MGLAETICGNWPPRDEHSREIDIRRALRASAAEQPVRLLIDRIREAPQPFLAERWQPGPAWQAAQAWLEVREERAFRRQHRDFGRIGEKIAHQRGAPAVSTAYEDGAVDDAQRLLDVGSIEADRARLGRGRPNLTGPAFGGGQQ